MSPKLTALWLIVVPCLLAGTGAKGCEPADCAPAVQVESSADPEEVPPRPAGPARIIDEVFNEIAATDDDDPDLAAALYAYHVRAEVLASRTVPTDEAARETDAAGKGATAAPSPSLTLPALSAVAIVLIFMVGCVAMARWRPPGD